MGVAAAYLLANHCVHVFSTSKNTYLENIGIVMATITVIGFALFIGYTMVLVGADCINRTQGITPNTSYLDF